MISSITPLSFAPAATARETYSGKSAAAPVEKNLEMAEESGPFTLMSKRLSCRSKASSPARRVPWYWALGSSSSSAPIKPRSLLYMLLSKRIFS